MEWQQFNKMIAHGRDQALGLNFGYGEIRFSEAELHTKKLNKQSCLYPFFTSSFIPSSKPLKSFLMWYDVTPRLSPKPVTVM